MKKYISSLYIPLFLLMFACSSEDELTPSNVDKNYFAPTENATDEESLLRKAFYNTEKCYVLFNDTLRHEALGTDVNGDTHYFTETIDVGYVMTAYSQYQYKYTYLTTLDQKQEGISFVKDYLLGHLSTKLRPFSWLLVGNISQYTVSDGNLYYNDDKTFVSGLRCTAVATQNMTDMDENERKNFALSILKDVLVQKLTKESTATLLPFTKHSASHYGATMDNYPDDEAMNMLQLNEGGFISPSYLWGVYVLLGQYPTTEEDIKAFTKLVLSESEESVNEQYSQYPLVISKFNAMKAIITNLGYIF